MIIVAVVSGVLILTTVVTMTVFIIKRKVRARRRKLMKTQKLKTVILEPPTNNIALPVMLMPIQPVSTGRGFGTISLARTPPLPNTPSKKIEDANHYECVDTTLDASAHIHQTNETGNAEKPKVLNSVIEEAEHYATLIRGN